MREVGWLSLLLVSLAAVYDWRTSRVPNWLTLGVMAMAPVLNAAGAWGRHDAGAAMQGAGMSLLGIVACGLVPLVLWRFGCMGGGDVKLLAAMGAVMGPTLGVECSFYAFAVATLLIAFRLAWNGTLLRTIAGGLGVLVNPVLPRARRIAVPIELTETYRFAPAALAGVLLATLMHGGSL